MKTDYKVYQTPEFEIVVFEQTDIINTSEFVSLAAPERTVTDAVFSFPNEDAMLFDPVNPEYGQADESPANESPVEDNPVEEVYPEEIPMEEPSSEVVSGDTQGE